MNDQHIDKVALQEFIRQHSTLWWWVPDEAKVNLSLHSIIETIVNYGNLGDIKELFKIIGIKTAADIFYQVINDSRRTNFSPAIQNFFKLYFERHA
jgi:hypothetical protein